MFAIPSGDRLPQTARRFVHRDLAARNVLMAAGPVFRVADFGLSRAISAGEGGEYYRSAAGVFPVRWTAPEAMKDARYTYASDVWSFAVTVVEVAVVAVMRMMTRLLRPQLQSSPSPL